MKNSSSVAMTVLTLLILASGAAISFFSWNTGLLLMLAAVGSASISRYYLSARGFAGSLALMPAVIIGIYIFGAIDRDVSLFSTNISSTVRAIIIVGSIALVGGLWLGGISERSGTILTRCDISGEDFFFGAGVVALILSAVNYATGDIALLAEDIDSTRYGGNFGALGHLWSLIHPVSQVSVIVALLMYQQRRIQARWIALGLCSVASLALTGGRSLVAIPFIAFGIIYLEFRRPRVQAVLLVVLAGLLAIGALGQARNSSFATNTGGYVYGPSGWFNAVDRSLQTGPRVLTLAIDRLQGVTFSGQFIIGDLPYVRHSAVGSDRMVTELLGRDPNTVGGLPPTIFGGFYLDFAWTGVIIGAFIVGLLLAVARRIMYRAPNLSTLVWFGYFAAYIAISAYSYVSFRPSWIVVLLVCMAAAMLSGETNGANTGSLEVQEISRRG